MPKKREPVEPSALAAQHIPFRRTVHTADRASSSSTAGTEHCSLSHLNVAEHVSWVGSAIGRVVDLELVRFGGKISGVA